MLLKVSVNRHKKAYGAGPCCFFDVAGILVSPRCSFDLGRPSTRRPMRVLRCGHGWRLRAVASLSAVTVRLPSSAKGSRTVAESPVTLAGCLLTRTVRSVVRVQERHIVNLIFRQASAYAAPKVGSSVTERADREPTVRVDTCFLYMWQTCWVP